jgi:MFS family permease
MEKNLRLYPLYLFCSHLHFWLAVFFLYLSSKMRLDQVLQLEAIYYISVVLLEVPSGYFSDRIGRKVTLLISGLCWMSAYLVFAGTETFLWFAAAQVLLAAGFAFASGTDTSLLFDSLQDLGRENELIEIEGSAHANAFIATAIAAVVGGIAAGVDLRLAYLLSAVGAIAGIVVVLRMTEPKRHSDAPERSILTQLGTCLGHLKNPVLLWTFAMVVGSTVINHVPYEFFQPYLGFILPEGIGGTGLAATPVAAGGVLAVTMLISSFFARRTRKLKDRLSTTGTLLGTTALQLAVMLVMALFLHPLVVLLIFFRSVPAAVLRPISNAAIHPRLDRGIRATYLSIQSLGGRLAFSLSLVIASVFVGPLKEINHPTMASVLYGYSGLAILMLVVLGVSAPFVQRRIHRETDQPR